MVNAQQLTLTRSILLKIQLLSRLFGVNGRQWLEAFKQLLCMESPWSKWKIWTCADVGLGIPLFKLVESIKRRGINIYYSSTIPLNLLTLKKQIKFNVKRENGCFVFVTPKELGLKQGFTKQDLFATATKRGLSLCYSGDILEILSEGRFNLSKEDRFIWVAMNPIIKENQPIMFCVARYKHGYYLGYLNGDLQDIYNHPLNLDEKHLFRA